jgi:hypothetical protein
MPYIGQSPSTGQFIELDALTASATDTYTLQLNSANFAPESVNNLIVSINGVVQKPSSMSLNGSSLTVGATLSSSDTIDYVRVLGHVGSVVTPTDGSVTSAKLDTNIAISGNLDVGTIRSTNGTTAMSVDSSGRVTQPNKPSWHVYYKTGSGGTGLTGVIAWNTAHKNVGTMCNLSTGIVTVPVTGTYYIYTALLGTNSGGGAMSEDMNGFIDVDTGSGFTSKARVFNDFSIIGNGSGYITGHIFLTYPLSASDQIRINVSAGHAYAENNDDPFSYFGGFLIG